MGGREEGGSRVISQSVNKCSLSTGSRPDTVLGSGQSRSSLSSQGSLTAQGARLWEPCFLRSLGATIRPGGGAPRTGGWPRPTAEVWSPWAESDSGPAWPPHRLGLVCLRTN